MKITSKILLLPLTGLYFVSNCLLLNAVETNFWKERQKKIELAQNIGVTSPFSYSTPVRSVAGFFGNSFRSLTQQLRAFSAVASARVIHNSGSQSTIVHIQDIHGDPTAQTSIAQIVKYFEGKAAHVAVEGAFRQADLSGFEKFSDKAAIRSATNALLTRGEISGALFAALNSGKHVSLVGIDDESLYHANVEAYRSSLKFKLNPRFSSESLDSSLQKISRTNPALARLEMMVRDYRAGRILLSQFSEQLSKYVSYTPDVVKSFLQVQALEKTLDQDRARKEREALKQDLEHQRNQLEKLSRSTSLADSSMTVELFDHELQLVGINPKKYSALRTQVQYVGLVEKVDPETLLENLQSMMDAARASLCRSDFEKSFVRESDLAFYSDRLINFSLTSKEWDRYSALRSGTISKLNPYHAFYEFAKARDHAMAKHVLKLAAHSNSGVIVLVTGGFHSSGIDAALVQAGYNVINVTPRAGSALSAPTESLHKMATASPFELILDHRALFLSPLLSDGLVLAAIGTSLGSNLKSDSSAAEKTFRSLLPGIPVNLTQPLYRAALQSTLKLKEQKNGGIFPTILALKSRAIFWTNFIRRNLALVGSTMLLVVGSPAFGQVDTKNASGLIGASAQNKSAYDMLFGRTLPTGTNAFTAGPLLQEGNFNDPQLSAFIAEALTNNPGLKVIESRFSAAQAFLSKTRWAMGPTGSGSIEAGFPGKPNSDGSQRQTFIFSLSLLQEIDVFGRARNEKRAALNEFKAEGARVLYAQQSLAAQIALSYFSIIEANTRHTIATNLVANALSRLKLAQSRQTAGAGTQEDVILADIHANQVQSDLSKLAGLRLELSRALEVSLGRAPTGTLTLSNSLPDIPATNSLPATTNLNMRADVKASQFAATASSNRVAATQAARLPKITIGGTLEASRGYGYKNYEYYGPIDATKYSMESVLGNLAAGLVLDPVLNFGKNLANKNIAVAERTAAGAEQIQAEHQASLEIQNAISKIEQLRKEEQLAVKNVADMTLLYNLSRKKFEGGISEKGSNGLLVLDGVLSKEADLLAAQTELVKVRAALINAYVELRRAQGTPEKESATPAKKTATKSKAVSNKSSIVTRYIWIGVLFTMGFLPFAPNAMAGEVASHGRAKIHTSAGSRTSAVQIFEMNNPKHFSVEAEARLKAATNPNLIRHFKSVKNQKGAELLTELSRKSQPAKSTNKNLKEGPAQSVSVPAAQTVDVDHAAGTEHSVDQGPVTTSQTDGGQVSSLSSDSTVSQSASTIGTDLELPTSSSSSGDLTPALSDDSSQQQASPSTNADSVQNTVNADSVQNTADIDSGHVDTNSNNNSLDQDADNQNQLGGTTTSESNGVSEPAPEVIAVHPDAVPETVVVQVAPDESPVQTLQASPIAAKIEPSATLVNFIRGVKSVGLLAGLAYVIRRILKYKKESAPLKPTFSPKGPPIENFENGNGAHGEIIEQTSRDENDVQYQVRTFASGIRRIIYDLGDNSHQIRFRYGDNGLLLRTSMTVIRLAEHRTEKKSVRYQYEGERVVGFTDRNRSFLGEFSQQDQVGRSSHLRVINQLGETRAIAVIHYDLTNKTKGKIYRVEVYQGTTIDGAKVSPETQLARLMPPSKKLELADVDSPNLFKKNRKSKKDPAEHLKHLKREIFNETVRQLTAIESDPSNPNDPMLTGQFTDHDSENRPGRLVVTEKKKGGVARTKWIVVFRYLEDGVAEESIYVPRRVGSTGELGSQSQLLSPESLIQGGYPASVIRLCSVPRFPKNSLVREIIETRKPEFAADGKTVLRTILRKYNLSELIEESGLPHYTQEYDSENDEDGETGANENSKNQFPAQSNASTALDTDETVSSAVIPTQPAQVFPVEYRFWHWLETWPVIGTTLRALFSTRLVRGWMESVQIIATYYVPTHDSTTLHQAAHVEELKILEGTWSRWEWFMKYHAAGVPSIFLAGVVLTIWMAKFLVFLVLFALPFLHKKVSLWSAQKIHTIFNYGWEYVLRPMEIAGKVVLFEISRAIPNASFRRNLEPLIVHPWAVPAIAVADGDFRAQTDRKELKFGIPEGRKVDMLYKILVDDHGMDLDPEYAKRKDTNPLGYEVCSVYYDDEDWRFAEEREKLLKNRVKPRVRGYQPGTDSIRKVEIKNTEGFARKKKSFGIRADRLAQFNQMIVNGSIENIDYSILAKPESKRDQQYLREAILLSRDQDGQKRAFPRIIVRYWRIAFEEKSRQGLAESAKLRMNLDFGVSYREYDPEVHDRDFVANMDGFRLTYDGYLQEGKGTRVFEIKYAGLRPPLWVFDVIRTINQNDPGPAIKWGGYSKYADSVVNLHTWKDSSAPNKWKTAKKSLGIPGKSLDEFLTENPHFKIDRRSDRGKQKPVVTGIFDEFFGEFFFEELEPKDVPSSGGKKNKQKRLKPIIVKADVSMEPGFLDGVFDPNMTAEMLSAGRTENGIIDPIRPRGSRVWPRNLVLTRAGKVALMFTPFLLFTVWFIWHASPIGTNDILGNLLAGRFYEMNFLSAGTGILGATLTGNWLRWIYDKTHTREGYDPTIPETLPLLVPMMAFFFQVLSQNILFGWLMTLTIGWWTNNRSPSDSVAVFQAVLLGGLVGLVWIPQIWLVILVLLLIMTAGHFYIYHRIMHPKIDSKGYDYMIEFTHIGGNFRTDTQELETVLAEHVSRKSDFVSPRPVSGLVVGSVEFDLKDAEGRDLLRGGLRGFESALQGNLKGKFKWQIISRRSDRENKPMRPGSKENGPQIRRLRSLLDAQHAVNTAA